MSSPVIVRAQTLVIPNPFQLNIAGPGLTASNVYTVTTSPATTITSITLGSVATSGSSGNWLCATASGATITYAAGIGCSTTTTQLTPGLYNGNIPFTTNTGLSGAMQVNLTVGSSGGTAGLTFSPNPVTFTLTGSQIVQQNVNIFFNGLLATITSVSASSTTGNWLSASNTGSPGVVTVTANAAGLSGGYSGTVFVTTTNGSFSFPVTMNASGGSTFGLAASPNPVTFNLASGSSAQQQNVNITFNGALVTSTSVQSSQTNSGQNWLNVFNSQTPGIMTVVANPQFFTGSSDTANVTVNTSAGQLTFQVTLNNTTGGSGFGLSATPNPVNLSASFSGATASQNVTVSYNGSPISANVISTSTSTGQNWLQAIASGSLGGIGVTAFNPFGLAGS